MSGSVFDHNSVAQLSGGGAIHSFSGSLTVANCTFTANSNDIGGGGAIYILSGTAKITGSTFSGNSTNDNGGAIDSSGDVEIHDSTFMNNTANHAFGSGGAVISFGSMIIDRSTFSNNSSGTQGGGIDNNTGSMTITNSTISNNTTGAAGGGGVAGGGIISGGTLDMTNCTVTGNTATGGQGGGIHQVGGSIAVSYSTLAGNTADDGGGLYVSFATHPLQDTIVAGNAAPSGPDIGGFGDVSGNYNLIGNGDGMAGLVDGVNNNKVGNAAHPINPLLSSLADNGGPTRTMALQTGSPAIDAGADPGAGGPTTDQRGTGFARVVNGKADIGAFELQGTSPPPNTPPTISDIANQSILPNGTAGPLSFVVADSETPAGSLAVQTKSSNTSLVPDANILISGSGGNRTVTVTPTPGQTGVATITVTVRDGPGLSASDDFTILVAPPPAASALVAGSVQGAASIFKPDGIGHYGSQSATISLFAGFAGQVRSAVADVNNDGFTDTILVTGPDTPIRIAVVSGVDNSTVLVAPFDPFGGNFTGGGFVAAADLDGDGRAEFVVTPDQGGGPRVSIFSLLANGTLQTKANFLGIDDSHFRGGARPALGDVDEDRIPDLLIAAGFGGGPRVALFNGSTLFTTRAKLVNDFFAFPDDATTLRNGIFAALGDIDGDGSADLVFGGGPGGAPRVYILSGQLLMSGSPNLFSQPVANFFVAGNANDRGGVRLAVKNADGDAKADLVVGSGEGSPANVRVYLGVNFTGTWEPGTFQDLDAFGGAALADGVFVG